MFCYFCGKENSDRQKFCKYCGQILHPQTTVQQDTEITDTTYRSREEEPHPEVYTGKKPVVEKRSEIKGLLIAIVVLLSLLLVVLGVCIAVFIKGNPKRREVAETSAEVTAETEKDDDLTESTAKEENQHDKGTAEDHDEETGVEEEAMDAQELFGQFLTDKKTAVIFDKERTYSELEAEFEIEQYEYRDVDNDGEDELLVYSPLEFYPLVVLDAYYGDINDLCSGEGTAGYLNFYEAEGKTWACFSDTSHAGRQIYNFVQYKGRDIVDKFTLSAEYWDNANDRYDAKSDFLYRGNKISMQEYEELLEKYTGIEPDHSIPELSEISINSTQLEDYTAVSYQGYRSDRGSKNFRFIYPVNLYENVVHNSDTGITDAYGTLTEEVLFSGGGGSSLEYKMYRRTEKNSKEDMLTAVYLSEAARMLIAPGTDPNIIAPKVSDGYGLAVFSGLNADGVGIAYEVIDIEDEYILIMRVVTPNSEAAKTMTADLYEGCGFNRDSLWGRE